MPAPFRTLARHGVIALALVAMAWPNAARSNEPGLDGRWSIVAVDGQSTANGGHLQFDGIRFGGKTACNRVGGHYRRTAGTLTFGPVVMTKMACLPTVMDLERTTVDAMGAVRTIAARNNVLSLLDVSGRERLRLARAS